MQSTLRRAIAALIALAALAAVALATIAPAAQAQSLKGVKLRIGGQTDGLRALLVASGALDGKQYAISWSTFSSGPPLLEAIQAGKIDLGGAGNTPPIFAAATKANFRLVAAIEQRNRNGDEIVVPKSSAIASVKDLKGKTIANTRGSSGHGYLLQALERAGLKPSDVKLRDLTPADALAAFSSGSVDAWATWEPFISIASANARVLDGGGGYAASGLSWVIAQNKALADVKKRTAIRDYLVRLKRALAWGAKNQDAWAKAFNEESGLPIAVAKQAIAKTLVDVKPAKGRVVSTEQTLANALASGGVVKKVDIRAITSNQLAG